jgi:3-carboxy-cis,cis-muconate cycloisomerase
MATASSQLLDSLFTTSGMREVFCDRVRIQRMLDFEAALASAQAKVGIIPGLAAQAIAQKCDAALFDFDGLRLDAAQAGNLAIPLVKQLTELVARDSAEAAKFVHWGATSQDAIDTGSVLQLREALSLIEQHLGDLANGLVIQIKRHRNTLMVGRTWLQHALPITFGLKAAGWLAAITRDRQRLKEIRPRVLELQFGGAAGTLASLGSQGIAVAVELAQGLGLEPSAAPWHSQRDRVAEVATTLGLLVGTLGKIARDVSLCMQTDVAELAEPAAPGRGGSSTMPHKRNPVGCATALSAAVRVPGLVSTVLAAMPQEHERGLGGWQVEWNTLPEIAMLAAGALDRMTEVIAGLEVDSQRMRANLDRSNGLIMAEAVAMALGRSIGKLEAHRVVEQACLRAVRESRHLHDVLFEDPVIQARLTVAELEKLMDPAHYLGATQEFIDRVLFAAGADGK